MTTPTPSEAPLVAPPVPEWLPVPDAADAAGVPVRSLYRWIEKKRVPTKADGTATLVKVSEVRAYAARRAAMKPAPAAGTASVIAGTPPAIQAVTGTASPGGNGTAQASGTASLAAAAAAPAPQRPAPMTEGELVAEVFSRFDGGAGPVDVVRDMKLLPDRVRALHREWSDLRALSGAGPSIRDRVASLEESLAAVEARLGRVADALDSRLTESECSTGSLLGRLEALEQRVAGIPLPSAEKFSCPRCRTHGRLKTTVWCGCCEAPFTTEVRRP
jgi:hypothetical protein